MLVVNAGCYTKVINWLKENLDEKNILIENYKERPVLLALQGPESIRLIELITEITISSLPRFGHAEIALKDRSLKDSEMIFIARTGYTGEEGFELILTANQGKFIWNKLIEKGATPCGLGARDTLRLETGMHLYGNDISDKTSPLEAGLGWLCHLEMSKDFIGRKALEKQLEEGLAKKFVGLELNEKAIARKGYKLYYNNLCVGEITSGSWSPSLKKGIALAYVPTELSKLGTILDVEIRGAKYSAKVIKKPFYRRGI